MAALKRLMERTFTFRIATELLESAHSCPNVQLKSTPKICLRKWTPSLQAPQNCRLKYSCSYFHSALPILSLAPRLLQHSGVSHQLQYHTSQCNLRKHVKKTKGRQSEAQVHAEETGADDEEDIGDESPWDAILAEDDLSEVLDPVPLGGHRFLVIQPDLKTKGEKHHLHADSNPQLQLEESVALVRTIQDWTVAEATVKGVKEPAKKTVFGKGTYAQLTDMIRNRPEITAVFLSLERLTALQQKELEDSWGVRVYDRYAVVLKIFKDHARTREAKMQIALAEIPYLRSQLRSESGNMDQQRGGHSFISGGGETFLTVQQRVLKERERKVRRALDQLRKKRGVLRGGRVRRNYPVVSVVGYTNAGKTSLIKALTGDVSMQPKDQLFATLDVTAHKGILPNRMPVIYMDTVGFISSLPHTLVASFAATLEDVLLSDIIVHVRDISHPDSESQKQDVLQVLTDLGVSDALMDSMVEVCNKTDQIQEPIEEDLGASAILVSAKDGTGLDRLKESVQKSLMEVCDIIPCQLQIPMGGPQLSWLYKEASVTSTEALVSDGNEDEQSMIVNAVMTAASLSKFCAKFGDLRRKVA